jgi:membrane fusion protein (multidrug efflux system)
MTKRMKQLALIGVPVLVLVGALTFWLQGGRHISTENAFVKADIAQIASEVPGRIIELRIQDHSAVAAGDVLLRLDPTPYQLSLAKAEAEIDSARAAVEQLKASLHEIRAETKEAERVHKRIWRVAEDTVDAALTDLAGAERRQLMTLLQRIKKTLVSTDDGEGMRAASTTASRRRTSLANGRLNGRAAP